MGSPRGSARVIVALGRGECKEARSGIAELFEPCSERPISVIFSALAKLQRTMGGARWFSMVWFIRVGKTISRPRFDDACAVKFASTYSRKLLF